MSRGSKLTVSELCLFGVLGGLTFAATAAMMGLPNIEPASLMILLFGAVFGKKALYPTYVFVALELVLHGIGLWSIGYLYVWPLLAVAGWLLRDMTHPLGWALVSGGFGLLFGALCAPAALVTGGPAYALSWWISGIPFDLLHCAGNFVIALVLFTPLRALTETLYSRLPHR